MGCFTPAGLQHQTTKLKTIFIDMTTIQSLRLMAEGNASLTSEETYAYLTRAASELSALQKEVAHLKSNVSPVDYKWAFENLEREMVKLIDNAVTAEIERLHIRISTLQAEVDFLRLESENMALSLESAGYGRPSGKMCTPLERYRSKYPRSALNSTKGEK